MKEVESMKEIFSALIKKPVTVGLKGPVQTEFNFTVQGVLGNIVVGTDEAEQKVQFVYMNHIGYIVTDNTLLIPEMVEVAVQSEPEYKNVLQTVLKQDNNKQESNSNSQQSSRKGKVIF